MPDIQMLDIRLLGPDPANIREDYGELDELAQSIKAHGILQPVIVRPDPDQPGYYRIIAGHRRTKAAILAGKTTVPAVIRAAISSTVIELMLIENCQRLDLGPVEKAEAMGKLRRRGMSAAAIGKAIGLHPATVSDYLTLLDLDSASLERVRRGEVAVGAAKAAVRQVRRQTRKRAGDPDLGRPKVTARTDHFSKAHPLADAARIRCQLAGHSVQYSVFYGRDQAKRNVACGECWEYVIRADERGDDLPRDTPPPTTRQERIQRLAELPPLQTGTSAPDGCHISAGQAAEQLGVTSRTIERYKAEMAGAR